MEPTVTKRQRKVHLSYELPHRIYCAQIYPITTPNGSTIVLYGHDRGLRILWRGGRRCEVPHAPQAPSRRRPNGTRARQEVVEILDDDNGQYRQLEQDGQDGFEAEDEELDPDCPYPNIIAEADVDLEAGLLQLAIPSLPAQPSRRTADMLKAHGVVAVSCSDGSQRVLTFPLAPPAGPDAETYAETIRSTQVAFPATGLICSAIAAKIVAADVFAHGHDSQASDFLLVTAISDILRIYRFSIFDELTHLEQDASTKTAPLPYPATHITFHPSPHSTQLLVSDVSGAVRLYDPYSPVSSLARPPSSDSSPPASPSSEQLGKWIFVLHTSFTFGNNRLTKRKQILDTKWVMGGKAILVLLEDGEWGVWDLGNSSTGSKPIEDFTLHGFLVPSGTEPAVLSQPKRGPRLAPMTPNTRKVKAEALFSGTRKVPGASARGGISVTPSGGRLGHRDESVLIWYNYDIYSIPSLQAFWQRSTSGNSGTFGSLHSPGLTHIQDVNLMNESITSISQFTPTASSNNSGQMNMQRDLLVSAEHRFIILQSLRPPTPSRALFQPAAAEPPPSQDQIMLDAGQLDLGGMDRMLDSMANNDARPRRVGFAS